MGRSLPSCRFGATSTSAVFLTISVVLAMFAGFLAAASRVVAAPRDAVLGERVAALGKRNTAATLDTQLAHGEGVFLWLSSEYGDDAVNTFHLGERVPHGFGKIIARTVSR